MGAIVITGTPGTGKTSVCRRLCEMLEGARHYEISRYIKENKLYSEHDAEFDSLLFDADLLEESISAEITSDTARIAVLDFHCCDVFAGLDVLLVVVLRCRNDVLRCFICAKISAQG
eukprot:GHVP01018964.1.p1 GENE.GHVP01018964.1~~GHVP01018964.1.p1  ORF type:complete len:117 (-),score=4.08 GHVP01018964.1:260-610(-)